MVRTWRAAALVALVAVVLAVSFGPVPAQAYAPGVCPPGSWYQSQIGVCVDMKGNVTAGSRTGLTGPPKPLEYPSSTLAAAEEAGTASENANAAGAIGTAAEEAAAAGEAGGGLSIAGGLAAGGQVIAAGAIGFGIGTAGAHFACNFGVSALCVPKPAPDFKADSDVVVINGDPGIVPVAPWAWSQCIAGYGACVSNAQVTVTLSASGTFPNIGSTTPYGPFVVAVSGPTPGRKWAAPLQISADCVDGKGGYVVTGSSNVQLASNDGTTWVSPVQSGTFGCSAADGGVKDIDFWQNYWSDLSGTVTIQHQDLGHYYPPGSTLRPPDNNPNPARQWQTVGDCVDSAGNHASITATSGSFTETDATFPEFPDLPACPAGSVLGGVKVDELGAGVPTKQVWSVTIPAAIQDLARNHPECLGGTCQLGLWKLDGTEYRNCFGGADCNGWFQDANKASDYACTYGTNGATVYTASQVVDLSECTAIAPAFDPQRQAQGTPYGDPTTGAAVDTTTDTATNTDPGPGGAGAPLPGADGASCWPSGWSVFNPAEWVLQPIKCALTWAFVPPASVQTQASTEVKADMAKTGIDNIAAGVTGIYGAATDTEGSGCDGPSVTFPMTSTTMHPFSACADPMKTVASVSYAFSTVAICIFGLVAIMKAVGAGFGINLSIGNRGTNGGGGDG